MTRSDHELLLGEWACLGVLAAAPTHGFAVAQRLRHEGDLGRVWSLSRALTYRALDQLTARGLVEPVGTEVGVAGGQRTVLTATAHGRKRLEEWLSRPVLHLRDLRSELLLKLLLCDVAGQPTRPLLLHQREVLAQMAAAHAEPIDTAANDVVAVWRHEASRAAVRFVDRLLAAA